MKRQISKAIKKENNNFCSLFSKLRAGFCDDFVGCAGSSAEIRLDAYRTSESQTPAKAHKRQAT